MHINITVPVLTSITFLLYVYKETAFSIHNGTFRKSILDWSILEWSHPLVHLICACVSGSVCAHLQNTTPTCEMISKLQRSVHSFNINADFYFLTPLLCKPNKTKQILLLLKTFTAPTRVKGWETCFHFYLSCISFCLVQFFIVQEEHTKNK